MWFLILLFIVVILVLYVDTRKPRNFPPGPIWFPIIGCALQLRNLQKKKGTLAKAAEELALQYGPLIGARIGLQRTVFVCGLKAMKEMYSRDELNGRPDNIFSSSRTLGKRRGISFTDSEIFQEQKRFVLKHLKEYCFRREIMDDVLEKEVCGIIADIERETEKSSAVCINRLFGLHMVNSFCSLMTGRQINNEDEDMDELYSVMESFSENISLIGTTFAYFPFLIHIFPDLCGYSSYVNIHEMIIKCMRKMMKRLKIKKDDPVGNHGFIGAYLSHMSDSDQKNNGFSEDQLLAICLDLILGAYDTTCNTLGFTFFYLLLCPNVQMKVQEEIDRVVGRERLPTLEDRPRLPYVECVVLESLRMFAGRAFVIPRRTLKDTTFNGYFIPKNTILLGNSRGLLMTENVGWKDPSTFRPERFMKEGRVNIPDNYIAFGLGKRRCMGEIYARANIFLIIASLCQKFQFNAIPETPPKFDIVDSFTPSLKPFQAHITLR